MEATDVGEGEEGGGWKDFFLDRRESDQFVDQEEGARGS